MPCYSPIPARKLASGGVTFDVGGLSLDQARRVGCIDIPCGQCIGCRLARSRDWTLRCMHEASLWPANSFVTLTYADDKLRSPSLDYRDFQLFMKRLRFNNKNRPVRFFMCGEYGSANLRPHFHALLFNQSFSSPSLWSRTHQGDPLYTSAELDRAWQQGLATFGAVTHESAGYVTRYAIKEGSVPSEWLDAMELRREFVNMSRRPGIGADWLRKFRSDVFPCDYVVDSNGQKSRVPRFYDDRNQFHDPDLHARVKAERIESARSNWRDNTEARLRTKAEVKKAALRQLVRDL